MSHQTRFYACPNGVKIHYLEFGHGNRHLLVIPGIMSAAMTWGFVADKLASSYHVFVMDVRGRGLSDQRPGLGHSLSDYAADAAGLIDSLQIKGTTVLGHSMGARIGIWLAANFPGHVGRLILADPPTSGPGRRPYPVPLAGYLETIDRAIRGEPLEKRPNLTDAQHRLRSEWAPSCSKEAIIETHRSFHEEDIFGHLVNVGCPTLLVYAEQGNTVTDEEAREITKILPDGRLVKLPGVGHMMPWDNLDLFVQSFEEFGKT